MTRQTLLAIIMAVAPAAAASGPYTEMGINGYVDSATRRHADPCDPNAAPNPIFRGWATGVVEYAPAAETWSGPWDNPARALGPATGENFDIVSLGELDAREIARGARPGEITLVFGDPCDPHDERHIRNGRGYEFAVFENAFTSLITTITGSFEGQMLAELGYVEVSSNGRDFARFPAVSLTRDRVGPYGTLEVSNVHNLAGKHPNANGVCMGTPFDLDHLAGDPQVVSGAVDLNDIRYVRIVDVPGSGDFFDQAAACIDPSTWPTWLRYPSDHPIYDAWVTWGSGGFDLEAVGVLHEQQYPADVSLDGTVDTFDLMLLASAWQSHFGDSHWIARCDVARPKDLLVDGFDFAVFASQWRATERWRNAFKDEGNAP